MNRPIIKYCGNHSLHDIELTANSLADYLGFIFVKDSKRYVDPSDLASWLKRVKVKPNQKLVGVFIDPTDEEIFNVLFKVPLDVIQCHGHENPERILSIKRTFRLPVWKVIHHSEDALLRMKSYHGLVNGYIIDNKKGNQLGGTGERFDWNFIPEYLNEARRQNIPCLIAGGVSPENLTDLLNYQPDGIDLASGIESEKKKDRNLINAIEEKVE